MRRAENLDCDVVLVGGGLANSIIALQLRARRPELRVRMIDAAERAEGHTWSVFRSDLPPLGWAGLAGAFVQTWPGYTVSFPGHSRRLATSYASLTSASLAALVQDALGEGVMRGRTAQEVTPRTVLCTDGLQVNAPVVIDGRGARPSRHVRLGFQKFVGLELRLSRPHGLTEPCVMDATVRQEDGYRFIYVLPLGADRLLVEDTRYADAPELSVPRLESAVLRYARGKGWLAAETLRREEGVLPVALGGDISAYQADGVMEVPQVGLRGLFFHPTTGYSLPDAWRVGELVAAAPLASSAQLSAALRAYSQALWRDRAFYRALNRMLFQAAAPLERYKVLERFYRLPEPLIERFYAAQTTAGDKLRILSGRPPVPILRALAALHGDRHG